MRKFKAHVNRWVPSGKGQPGKVHITTVDIPWNGEKPLTAKEILDATVGGSGWQEFLAHQPGNPQQQNTDQWMFVLDYPTGNPEFVNIWIEDILPTYHQELQLKEAARQIDRLGDSIKQTELQLGSQKFQYEQAVARYNQLREAAPPQ